MENSKQTKGKKERRKLLESSCRTVSCHARRVRRVRREERGKRERRRNLLRWESGRMVCGRTRRIRRDEGMGLKGTKTQRHRWVKARLRDSRWARPSSVAQRRRKGREEQRSSVKTLWLKDRVFTRPKRRTLGAQAVRETTKWEELPTLSTNTSRQWESATADYTTVN